MPDVEKVIERLEYCAETRDGYVRDCINDALELLKGKTGHWIEEKPNEWAHITKCSVCGGTAPFICISDDYYGNRQHGEIKKTAYCPNCGANMTI